MSRDRNHNKPVFSAQAFWDVDSSQLDGDNYTIRKVFEQGNSEDISELLRYYSKEQIREALVSAEQLRPRAISLAQTLFTLKDNDFKCLKPVRAIVRRRAVHA